LTQISQYETTAEFVLSLSKSKKCENTSDFQGLMGGYYYHVTVLNSKNVDVFIYRDEINWVLNIFPKWNVSSIDLQK